MYIAISWYTLSHTMVSNIHTKKTNNVVYLPVPPSSPRMTFSGTVQLSHDSSTVVSTAELQRWEWLHAECYKAQCSKPCSCMWLALHTLTGVDSLDVEAMVGVWWVLIPLQKGPLKLCAQCGCGVGRKKQEELQHVGPLTVPASHIVPV